MEKFVASIPLGDVPAILLRRDVPNSTFERWIAHDPYAAVSDIPTDFRRAGQVWAVRQAMLARASLFITIPLFLTTQAVKSFTLVAIVCVVSLAVSLYLLMLHRTRTFETANGSSKHARTRIAGALYAPLGLLMDATPNSLERTERVRQAAELLANDAIQAVNLTNRDLRKGLTAHSLRECVDVWTNDCRVRLEILAKSTLAAGPSDSLDEQTAEICILSENCLERRWASYALDGSAEEKRRKGWLPGFIWLASAVGTVGLIFVPGLPSAVVPTVAALVGASTVILIDYRAKGK